MRDREMLAHESIGRWEVNFTGVRLTSMCLLNVVVCVCACVCVYTCAEVYMYGHKNSFPYAWACVAPVHDQSLKSTECVFRLFWFVPPQAQVARDLAALEAKQQEQVMDA